MCRIAVFAVKTVHDETDVKMKNKLSRSMEDCSSFGHFKSPLEYLR